MLSKRRLIRLVNEGHVAGWDDPRLMTIAALRRRGVTPEAIRDFCDLIGVAKANSLVDMGKLDFCIREDLNHRAPRVMCVLDPLEVEITTWDEGVHEEIDASYWPHDVPREGSRTLRFGRRLLVDREDWADTPPKGWHRLAPGREVRLRHGYVIRVDDVERNADGTARRILCSHDPATRDANPTDRRVRGTIHWVAADDAVPCEVRLYDRLFLAEDPGAERDFVLDLNPESLVVRRDALVEPAVAADPAGSRYQFERLGYFVSDVVDSRPDALVFNRIVTLRDTWAKLVARRDAALAASEDDDDDVPDAAERPAAAPAAPRTTIADERVRARAMDPVLGGAYARYTTDLGLGVEDADRLTGDPALVAFFDATVAACGDAAAAARWTVNEVLRELKDRTLDALPFDGAALGRLVALVESGRITAAAGKDVLGEMVAGGGDPAAIVQRRGLEQLSDESAVREVVEEVLRAHPGEVARYREGKTSLLGFFMGQVMRASAGRTDPALTKTLLARLLDGPGSA